MGHQFLPKRIALPVFTPDAPSSVVCVPDEILLTLALAGSLAAMQSLWVGAFVAFAPVAVVMSHRQTVCTYPSGGGDYEVTMKNLGWNWGLFVVSALLVDYILVAAISISSGTAYIMTTFPALHGHKLTTAVSLVVLLVFVNPRGTKDVGGALVISTYIYICSILLMILIGLIEFFIGALRQAPTAQYGFIAVPDHAEGLIGLDRVFSLMQAFPSGCAALTGVEVISNGVPMFKRPKSKSAAVTLAISGVTAATIVLSILLLARTTGARTIENPALQLTLSGTAIDAKTYIQPVIDQLTVAVFGNGSTLFLLITAVTGLILVLAVNTAFNGFPTLASVLSRGSFLPRQLCKRGDRLSYSNGTLTLAPAIIILIVAFETGATRPIELYVVRVFISFTLSQLGMIRYQNWQLRMRQNGSERDQVLRSRAVSIIGLMMTSLVLLIALMMKLTHGAWITLIMITLTFLARLGIRRHYDTAHKQLYVEDWSEKRALPTRVQTLVLASSLLGASVRAIAAARSSHPPALRLASAVADEEEERRTHEDWEQSTAPLPLTPLPSPYRDLTCIVLQHIRELRRQGPKEMLVIYMSRVLVYHRWENAMHDQMQERLRHALLTVSGVILTIVPWRLGEDNEAEDRQLVNDPFKTREKPTRTSGESV